MKKMLTYVRRNKWVIKFAHKKPRSSSLTKPRIDLSVFLSRPSVSNLPHLRKKSSPHENIDLEENILDLPLAQWTRIGNKRKAVASLDKRVTVKSQNKSSVVARKTGTSALESVPETSTISVCTDVRLNKRRVVWAKRGSHMWWPAEIMIRVLDGPNSATEATKGPFLVQYYATEESAWVDPARDLSPFEERCEERSRNPSKEFQEALKQAVHKIKQLISLSKH